MKEALIGSSSMPSISCLCHGVELLVRRNALEIEDASAAPAGGDTLANTDVKPVLAPPAGSH
jgi:hypothetical protein